MDLIEDCVLVLRFAEVSCSEEYSDLSGIGLFEVEGDHGLTLWTRRRIEDTRPSIVDPVSILDAAHGSHRVTQKNRSSPS